MKNQIATSIIFLAFANDRDDRVRYLRNLPEEARCIRAVLEGAKGLCELIVRQNTTTQEILDVFQNPEYCNRIAVFHFGGHANGYQLLLETVSGQAVGVDAGGLAAFLGQQDGLQLVFLNGCSTKNHVDGLLAANVSAVIATSQSIDDQVAMEFASRFYKGLAGGDKLGKAYKKAQAAVQMKWGNNKRGVYWLDEQKSAEDCWPWELYSGKEKIEEWSLPFSI